MRKFLLGTTAVVGAALIGTGAAQAQQAPTVRVGGFFEFSAGYVDDTIDRAPSVTAGAVTAGTAATGAIVPGVTPGAGAPAAGARPARGIRRDRTDFRSDLEIVITVTGKAANGLEYGAEIELQNDNVVNAGGAGNGGTIDTDEAWLFVRSPTLGTIQAGDQDSAGDQLRAGVGGMAGIQQFGYSSGWDEFLVANSDGTRYLLTTINDGNDATKIIYLSPQFFGFDFGVSYAPNRFEGEEFRAQNSASTSSGAAGAIFQRDRTTITNELSAGVRYRGSFGNVGVAASFSAMRADAAANNGVSVPAAIAAGGVAGLRDVTQYEVGAAVSAFGFSVNGFYSWGNFGGITATPIRQGLDTSSNYGLGLSYTAGPFAIGALYGQSTRDNGTFIGAGGGSAASASPGERKQTVISVGAVYTLSPGLQVFANYTNLEDENITNNASNPTAWAASGRNREADIFIVGTRLTF